jgi:plastocyanin
MRVTFPTTLFASLVLVTPAAAQAAYARTTDATKTVSAIAATLAAPIVEVRMTGNGSTKAAYEPSSLRIKSGTTVRFINVSGGPHNVTFYPDSIPAGAAATLQTGMPNPISELTGPLLTAANQTYDVSFISAPPGTYKAYCLPHVALGMKLTIQVE